MSTSHRRCPHGGPETEERKNWPCAEKEELIYVEENLSI
jgi:hypothetical protein